MACYRTDRDAKKANLAVTDNAVANVSEMKSSTTVEANCFTVSSPRMNGTDEVGLLDTGCNVLCMPKELVRLVRLGLGLVRVYLRVKTKSIAEKHASRIFILVLA